MKNPTKRFFEMSHVVFAALISVFTFYSHFTHAEISCRRLVSGNARSFELEHAFATPESLLADGIKLRNRAHEVDPETTYLPEYEGAVKQMAAQIQIMLREKKGQALHKDRSAILMEIVREIGERVQAKTITYEWAVALTLRVGFLSRMQPEPRNTSDTKIRLGLETPYYFQLSTYRTHSNFMHAYDEATKFEAPYGQRARSRLKENGNILFKSFPDKIFIPTFMPLTIPQVNRFFAAKVLPLGLVKEKFHAALDGQTFDEFDFPIHDIFHGDNQEYIPGATITPALADFIETRSVQIADQARGMQFDLFHLFHHLLFHEDNRHMYLNNQTRSGIINTMDQNIEALLGRVITFDADKEVYPEELLKMPLFQRGQFIRDAHMKYVELMSAAIQQNGPFVDSELLKMIQAEKQRRSRR